MTYSCLKYRVINQLGKIPERESCSRLSASPSQAPSFTHKHIWRKRRNLQESQLAWPALQEMSTMSQPPIWPWVCLEIIIKTTTARILCEKLRLSMRGCPNSPVYLWTESEQEWMRGGFQLGQLMPRWGPPHGRNASNMLSPPKVFLVTESFQF